VVPAADALFHYARGLGAARSGDLEQAAAERDRIQAAVRALRDEGDDYWAYMTEALGKAVDAWILHERGETERALARMSEAADLEDSMEKHPITPGEVLPVRELYGDMLLEEGRTQEAIAAYEASLERTPNRRYAEAGLERARASR
jgi:tetratricopeptide (TPR) repeat protein